MVEDVLSPAQVALANKAIDYHAASIQNRPADLSGGAANLVGRSGRGELRQNPLTFERPWCEPFRQMLVTGIPVLGQLR